MTVEDGAFVDDQSVNHNVTLQFTGGYQFNPSGSLDVAAYFSGYGHVAGLDDGLNNPFFSNDKVAVVVNLPVYASVNPDAACSFEVALDLRPHPNDGADLVRLT